MKRLYYLTRNIDAAERVSNNLHKLGITDKNFYVLSKNNESSLYRRHLHPANTLHKTDIIHGAELGSVYGLPVGILLALFLSFLPVYGVPANGLAMFFTVVFCVLLGGWIGGFIGIQTENYKIRKFHNMLDKGYFLILVDVEVRQEKAVREQMKVAFPEVKYFGSDTSIITPFEHSKLIKH